MYGHNINVKYLLLLKKYILIVTADIKTVTVYTCNRVSEHGEKGI